ncbi:EamA family transporter [Zhengella mangrovi]|uniref:EamA family transporter n=1 Tax=Zhengella mangrovi TaxID=1982044 RepID=A0A2G1QLU1_9HYPH|nr:EamA family transporter [Zhengella mangrovi]
MTRPAPAETATPTAAILLIAAACFLFACLDTSAKILVTSGMDARFVSWARFAEHAVLAFVLLRGWSNAAVLKVSSVPAQIIRGMLLFGSTFFNFMALQTLQLAETISIFFFAPMVITALAGPLLGEWAGWRRWAAVAVGFTGVLVITRPGMGQLGIGYLYVALAMLSYCFYVIMTRKLSETETPESLIFFSALTPAVLMAPVVPLYGSIPATPLHWAVLLGLGFFGGIGHWLLINAYKRATVFALAPYPYLQMVWMVLFGWLVFGDLPDHYTLGGSLIIIASGLYIVHRERILRRSSVATPAVRSVLPAKKR